MSAIREPTPQQRPRKGIAGAKEWAGSGWGRKDAWNGLGVVLRLSPNWFVSKHLRARAWAWAWACDGWHRLMQSGCGEGAAEAQRGYRFARPEGEWRA